MTSIVSTSQSKSIKLFNEILSILKETEDKNWLDWVVEQIKKLEKVFAIGERKDQLAVIQETRTYLLGGQGSFSDLCLCKENGHNVKDKDEGKINKRFSSLTNKLYVELGQLKFVLENYSEGQN